MPQLILAKIKDIVLSFETEERIPFVVKSPTFNISRVLSTKREIPFYPSIIGADFIKSNQFTLVYNPSKNIAYLEKEG